MCDVEDAEVLDEFVKGELNPEENNNIVKIRTTYDFSLKINKLEQTGDIFEFISNIALNVSKKKLTWEDYFYLFNGTNMRCSKINALSKYENISKYVSNYYYYSYNWFNKSENELKDIWEYIKKCNSFNPNNEKLEIFKTILINIYNKTNYYTKTKNEFQILYKNRNLITKLKKFLEGITHESTEHTISSTYNVETIKKIVELVEKSTDVVSSSEDFEKIEGVNEEFINVFKIIWPLINEIKVTSYTKIEHIIYHSIWTYCSPINFIYATLSFSEKYIELFDFMKTSIYDKKLNKNNISCELFYIVYENIQKYISTALSSVNPKNFETKYLKYKQKYLILKKSIIN